MIRDSDYLLGCDVMGSEPLFKDDYGDVIEGDEQPKKNIPWLLPVTLGTAAEGWTRKRAQDELRHTMADVERHSTLWHLHYIRMQIEVSRTSQARMPARLQRLPPGDIHCPVPGASNKH